MKIAYKYKKDGCNTELYLDNVNRIRQKGDHISLTNRNGNVALHISEKEMKRLKGKIELLPDETSSMSGDEMPWS